MKPESKALLLAVGGTLLIQLSMCYFFSFGNLIPVTNDINPSNQTTIRYLFPPQGRFSTDYWLGQGSDPMPFTPYSVLAWLPPWLFFTATYPLSAALAVLTFYWFLRELKLSTTVAIVGGLIYGWQGRILSNIYGGHFAPAMLSAMLPLAMWAAMRAIRLRSWCSAIVGGGVTGMMVATAFDQGALATLPVGFVFLAKAAESLWRKSGDVMRILGKLAVTMVVAVLVALSGLQIATSAGITGQQQAGTEDPKAKFAWATQWSWPPEETLTYLVPGFFGWRSGMPRGEYWGRIGQTENWDQTRQGFRNFSLDTCTLGTVPFLLLSIGVWVVCRKRPSAHAAFSPLTTDQLFYGRCFLGLGVALFLLSLGKYAPFYWYFYQLPYMSTWRNPIKFLSGPANFCLIALASYGLHALIELLRQEQCAAHRRALSRWLLGVVAVLALMFIATFFDAAGQGPALRRASYTAAEIASIAANQRLTVAVAAALVLLLWGAIAFRDKTKTLDAARLPSFAGVFVAVLVVGQLWWVHSHFLEPTNPKRAYQTNPLLDTLRHSPDPARVKLIAPDELLHFYLSTVFAYHGISTLDIPAASRLPEDYAQFFQALDGNLLRLWQLAGVKYLAAPAPQGRSLITHPLLQNNIARVLSFRAMGTRIDDVTVQAVPDPNMATHLLIELKDYLPKASFVPHMEILPTPQEVSRRLNAPDWNPRHTLLVTADVAVVAGLTAAPPSTRRGTVRLLRYENNRIEVEAQTDTGGYLLINDRYEPAWRAWIDGKPVPVFRANLILRGIPLPAGASRVVLRFEKSATTGYISLAALGLVLLVAVPCLFWKTHPACQEKSAL